MSLPRIDRRMFLRSAATGATIALPLLHDWVGRPARAAIGAPFKRYIQLFSPNGTVPDTWFPGGGRLDFTLAPIMAPLAAHRSDLILFRNVDITAGVRAQFGDAHGLGVGCLWTGIEPQSGELFAAGMGGPGSGWPNGPSPDQIIAQRLGDATKYPSLAYAIKTMSASIFSRISYRKAADPVTPESDPGKAFDSLFGLLKTDPAVLARLRRRRKSILDDVSSQLQALNSKVSPQDRSKIESHVTAVRELEARLATLDPGAGTILKGACRLPQRSDLGSGAEVKYNESGMEVLNGSDDTTVPDRHKAVRELIVMALACDLTRVVSLMLAPSRSDVVFSWLGHKDSHHNYSHEDLGTSANHLTEVNQWYSTQVATLIGMLKAIPEGNKTVFDSTTIVWGNELGIGQNHQRSQIPILVAGSAGGAFRTGQYINFPATRSQNDIFLSLFQAMGLDDVKTWGNPSYCTGPVTEMFT